MIFKKLLEEDIFSPNIFLLYKFSVNCIEREAVELDDGSAIKSIKIFEL